MTAQPEVAFFTAAETPWGAERSLAEIAGAIADAGGRVAVHCPHGAVGDYLSESLSTHDVAIFRYEKPRGRVATIWRCWRLAAALPQSTAIVLFSLYLLPISWLLAHRRLLVDLHDTPSSRVDAAAVRWGVAGVSGVICVSQFVADWIGERCTTAVVARPIARPRAIRARNPREQGNALVGVVGRLNPEKGIVTVIDALSRLDGAFALVVYGAEDGSSPQYSRALLDHARARGVHMRLAGVQPPDVIYSDIDYLVVANPREPHGRTVGEAMIRGVPVVVPDRGGAAEQVLHGRTGITYGSGDPDALAEALRLLEQDADARTSIIDNAMARVEEYSVTAVGLRYLHAIESLGVPS